MPRTAPMPRRIACDQATLEAALDHIFAFLQSVLPKTKTEDLSQVRLGAHVPVRARTPRPSDPALSVRRLVVSQAVQSHIDVLMSVMQTDKVR